MIRRFEHFALNVPNPPAMAAWYVAHMELRIVRQMDKAPFTHFLADPAGRTCLEIYCNPAAPVPDFRASHPLCFHFAFEVDDPSLLRDRLVSAGAEFFEEVRPAAGSLLVMLRDPWGIPLQLCKRAEPMP